MKKYQFSSFDERTPISCSVQAIDNMDSHIHDFFELDMVLSGTGSLSVDDRLYNLEPDDVFSIDPHVPHELRGKDCVLITIQFNQTLFENTLVHPLHPHFDCNSRAHGNSEAYNTLRRLIARIVKNTADKQTGYELRTRAMVYELMDLFYNNFRVESSNARDVKGYRYAIRIAQITEMIGLISASYPSAGAAMTSLTTSFCVDYLRFNERKDLTDNRKESIRKKVHAGVALLFLIIIVVLFIVSSDAVVNLVYKLASYTYGPLLGMFFFGILTKYKVRDGATPWIAVAAPVLCLVFNLLSKRYLGFDLGFTLLIVNGLLTFIGLWLFRRKETVK